MGRGGSRLPATAQPIRDGDKSRESFEFALIELINHDAVRVRWKGSTDGFDDVTGRQMQQAIVDAEPLSPRDLPRLMTVAGQHSWNFAEQHRQTHRITVWMRRTSSGTQ